MTPENIIYSKKKKHSLFKNDNSTDSIDQQWETNALSVNQYEELDEASGSYTSIALLKKKKCIISNVCDLICILFKNKRLFFETLKNINQIHLDQFFKAHF